MRVVTAKRDWHVRVILDAGDGGTTWVVRAPVTAIWDSKGERACIEDAIGAAAAQLVRSTVLDENVLRKRWQDAPA